MSRVPRANFAGAARTTGAAEATASATTPAVVARRLVRLSSGWCFDINRYRRSEKRGPQAKHRDELASRGERARHTPTQGLNTGSQCLLAHEFHSRCTHFAARYPSLVSSSAVKTAPPAAPRTVLCDRQTKR